MNGRYQSILVVCTGNICRSPVGERILRSRLPNMIVDSAGIAALTGEAADPVMVNTARENGLSLEGHCAKQLTPLMCREYDLILAMEQNHIEAVTRLAMEARGKAFLFGYWLQQMEIPDPYRRGRDISGVIFQQLFSAAEEWVKVFQQVK
ncbi:TPA: protein tyrosine phosphatase [Enterobacter cloacae]|nr:protein-tyrosine-phosphatase [Enterobacter cloacae]VAM16411.1 protein-tyrosine-phosphatase [Enterobacter kobei]HCC8045711.1 protein tyrosine phosphatase [Enterobacter cloacae]